MFANVIVPYDGSPAGRPVLSTASDLAWRAGAQVVVVSARSVAAGPAVDELKTRAMSKSGADVDFWVDTGNDLPQALLETERFRADPIICISVAPRGGKLGRKLTLPAMADEVLRGAAGPVLAVGPATDTSRGLDMTEALVVLEGGPGDDALLEASTAWCAAFKLRLVLIAVVPLADAETRSREEAYLARRAREVAGQVPEVEAALVPAPSAAVGVVDAAALHPSAVLVLGTRATGDSAVGPTALSVLARSSTPILLVRD